MEKLRLKIKKSGIKITPGREKILSCLKENSAPLSMNEIHEKIEKVDFASVYRNIKRFCDIGIVREINMGDKKTRYELINNEHFHHIICTECGKIEKIDICFLSKIKEMTDFEITNHHMEFTGKCPDCKKS